MLKNFFLGVKLLTEKNIGKVICSKCCSKNCMRNLNHNFIHQARSNWVLLSEEDKSKEIKKILESCESNEKNENTVKIGMH